MVDRWYLEAPAFSVPDPLAPGNSVSRSSGAAHKTTALPDTSARKAIVPTRGELARMHQPRPFSAVPAPSGLLTSE
ncbi:MAG: hypothetical protein ACKVVP_13235 [Chloroflexota bacterium]